MPSAASIEIAAPAEKVWTMLVSTRDWPAFDPFTVRVEGGKPAEGVRLRHTSTLDPERPFTARVTIFSPPWRMVWTGRRLPFGLLNRTRTFTVEENGRDNCRVELREEFSGPMRRVMARALPDMSEAFEGFCRGLKELAEA